MSLPRYPEYKDSGVEWLGEVPEHWGVAPFKWELECNDGGVWGDDPDGEEDTFVLRSTEQTVDGNWKIDDPAPRKLSVAEKKSTLLLAGDLLVTKSSGSSLHIGKTTLVTAEIEALECCYSNFMQRIRTKPSFSPKFAWYVMNNDIARLQFDHLSNSTTGLANLNSTMIGELLLAVPPNAEQQTIAAFLDRETGKIDALIAEQQRLVELLAEKRQAVISHAVTKGLNPDAPMKDSGIVWLGDVPERWATTRLKYATKLIVDCPHETPVYSEDGGYLVIRTADVTEGVLQTSNMYRVDENEFQRRIRRQALQFQDIVYGREGERWGLAALVPLDGDFCLGQRMMQFRSTSSFCPTFLMWQINSISTYRQGQIDTVGATSPHVNVSTIANYLLTEPPFEEQQAIAAFLNNETAKLDTLTAEASRAIALLQERRSALISAAVTGKIDARGIQALPQ